MSNFFIRTLSGAVFVIIIIGSILVHPWVFAPVFWIISLLALKEYNTIVGIADSNASSLTSYLLGTSLFFSAFSLSTDLFPNYFILILVNIPLISLPFLVELFSGNEKPFSRIAKLLLGILYISLPFSLLIFFYYPGFNTTQSDPVLLIALFSLIWINDTFAYLTGSLLGRHHLFPRISPKKTWEGLIGGAVFCFASALLISAWFPVLNQIQWLVFAATIIIFGTLGDLIESMLKRSYGIKDSGNIMPGHGGLLDRFDATLGAAPPVFFLLSVIWLL